MQQQAGPRRSPECGGYAPGGHKRGRIVDAALRIFGEQGYERASTRQIAADSGVSPPALHYYFTSKEGLHVACAEHIAQRLMLDLQPAYDRAMEVGEAAAREDAIEALCGIMQTLAHFLFGQAQAQGWSRFLARGQGEEPGPAYGVLRERISGGLHRHCGRLVGLATGQAADDPMTRLRTIAVLGQLSVFHLSRDNALAVMGWTDFGGEHLVMLEDMLRTHTRALLTGDGVAVNDAAPVSS
jgi:AcrR family transcriptional regulator